MSANIPQVASGIIDAKTNQNQKIHTGVFLISKKFIVMLMFASISGVGQEENKYYEMSARQFLKSNWSAVKFDYDNIDIPLMNAAIFHLTNLEREKRGMYGLSHDTVLEKAASFHSERMNKLRFFSHVNKKEAEYKNPEDRVKAFGLNNSWVGENIVLNPFYDIENIPEIYLTKGLKNRYKKPILKRKAKEKTYLDIAKELIKIWMHSPGHKQNILNKDYTHLGCGAYFYRDKTSMTVLATQNFMIYKSLSHEVRLNK